ASYGLGRQTVRQLLPIRAAVGRFVQTAPRTIRGRIDAPRRTPGVPKRRIDNQRVVRLEREIDRAYLVALEQHLLPRRAAVARAIDAAIRIRAVDVSERGDEHDVRSARVDDHLADLPRRLEADVPPRLAGIGRLVHAVAVGDLRSHVGLAGPDVYDIGIRRRHRNGADRGDRLGIEDRHPASPGIRRLPYAAADRPHVEHVRLPRHAGDAVHATRTEGTN